MKDFLSHYDIYILSILVVAVTLLSTYKNTRFIGKSNRIFAFLGIVILLTLFAEFLGWIVDKSKISIGIELNILVNSIIYAVTPFNTLLLTVYLHSIIFTYTKYTKEWFMFLFPIALNFILIFSNGILKYYFYIDSTNTYHRGKIFYVMIIISYVYIVVFLFYLIANKSKIKRNDIISLNLLLIFPVIGSVLQSFSYGVGTTWPMFSITYLGIHLVIQQS